MMRRKIKPERRNTNAKAVEVGRYGKRGERNREKASVVRA